MLRFVPLQIDAATVPHLFQRQLFVLQAKLSEASGKDEWAGKVNAIVKRVDLRVDRVDEKLEAMEAKLQANQDKIDKKLEQVLSALQQLQLS